ncbi:trans-sulfuration enzyme family protein [Roseovarius aestuarii]|uniref:Cystathionine gamma-synthase n=1 Tax=Roseovarius aestuarii TaxID=475083 RepID=A0A1X7BND3_9RHOB|nr:aminotransferase class V-fold PLP-dependent enzyme [Roseovarius aestuarii]SMC11125.1 Cystathionine gamma-synthase [Roseovarius aestuarii]
MAFKKLKPATIAARAAGSTDAASAGVVPGIHLATTYMRGSDNALIRDDNQYGRDQNDTVRQAEEVLRQLEGAAATRLFPSGMAAIAALFRTIPNGGRVVVQSGIYWGATAWIRDFCARRGVALTEVEATDLAELTAACAEPADLVWIEVPSNPWLRVVDIAAAAALARQAGALLAVDATAATPVLMHPLALGADMVMHSATKAINGHTDVLAGVLSCADADSAVWQAITADRHDAGAILGPFEAWLLLRGMRTLPLRLERMCASAQAVAAFLQRHPGVEDVFYPGLQSHPGHDIATQQMTGGCGYLMSVLIRGGREVALAVAGRLELFHRATSLGGVESLIEHRHTVESDTGIPENLLRLSIGIEDVDDLIADLDQALNG